MEKKRVLRDCLAGLTLPNRVRVVITTKVTSKKIKTLKKKSFHDLQFVLGVMSLQTAKL